MRSEEADGHLDNLVVRRVRARRGSPGGFSCGVALAPSGSASGCSPGGAASQHAGSPSRPGAGGRQYRPPALCLLGPARCLRRVAAGGHPAAYGLVAWSLCRADRRVRRPQHFVLEPRLPQMTAAPAVAPDWTSAIAMVLLGWWRRSPGRGLRAPDLKGSEAGVLWRPAQSRAGGPGRRGSRRAGRRAHGGPPRRVR